jgi:hypothetical protein
LKQKYIFLRENKKLHYLVNLKIKGNLIKIKIFKFNYTITESIKKFINHRSLVMTLNLNINPDPAIAREKIYQNYIHECQMFLVEVPKLAEKLATYLNLN